jgi:hypothetical protein
MGRMTELNSRQGQMWDVLSSPPRPDGHWDLPSFLSNAYREALIPGVKRLGREADHSPPSSTEVKNT